MKAIAILSTLAAAVYGYSDGDMDYCGYPACSTAVANPGATLSFVSDEYGTDRDFFYYGDKIRVTINSTIPYIGFQLHATLADPGTPFQNVTGNWTFVGKNDEYMYRHLGIGCGGNPIGAIGHNITRKNNPATEDTLLWVAPSSFNQNVTIHAIVYYSTSAYAGGAAYPLTATLINAGPEPDCDDCGVPPPPTAYSYNQCAADGQLALTFDEGPSDMTTKVLEALKAADAKATFHVVTAYVNDVTVSTYMRSIVKNGHIIGLCYPTQVNPQLQSDQEVRDTLIRESKKVFSVAGVYPKYLRLPIDRTDERLINIASGMGFIITTWNVDPFDYDSKNGVVTADRIINTYAASYDKVPEGTARYIGLHHDVPAATVYNDLTALPKVVAAIKAKKYKLVTLDVCVPGDGTPGPYREPDEGPTTPDNGTVIKSGADTLVLSLWAFVFAVFGYLLA